MIGCNGDHRCRSRCCGADYVAQRLTPVRRNIDDQQRRRDKRDRRGDPSDMPVLRAVPHRRSPLLLETSSDDAQRSHQCFGEGLRADRIDGVSASRTEAAYPALPCEGGEPVFRCRIEQSELRAHIAPEIPVVAAATQKLDLDQDGDRCRSSCAAHRPANVPLSRSMQ